MAESSISIIALVAGGIAVLIAASLRAWRLWRRYSEARIVTCPETARPAAVRVDSMRATASALFDSHPAISLRDCSRWPERRLCTQPCVGQIESGEAPAISSLAGRWYAGKPCVYCHKSISAGPGGISRAALLGSDGTTVEWHDLAPERLVSAFSTYYPVCWNCHVAETFRRMYPELVVDRPPH